MVEKNKSSKDQNKKQQEGRNSMLELTWLQFPESRCSSYASWNSSMLSSSNSTQHWLPNVGQLLTSSVANLSLWLWWLGLTIRPLTDRQIELLDDKAVAKYLSALEKMNDHYMQIFGDIESVCDIPLRENLKRMDE